MPSAEAVRPIYTAIKGVFRAAVKAVSRASQDCVPEKLQLQPLYVHVFHTSVSTLPQGLPESKVWTAGGRSLDLAEPMTAEETAAEHLTPLGILSWVLNSLSLWPPPGLRHHAQPTNGALVRNCVLLEQDLVAHGSIVPLELTQFPLEQPAAGGFKAMKSFRKMMSMGAWDGGGGSSGARKPMMRTMTGTHVTSRTPSAVGLLQPLFRGGAERPPQILEEVIVEETEIEPETNSPDLKRSSV